MRWALLVVFAAGVNSQQPQFQTRAREVIVPVSVLTKAGNPVEGLSAQDFAVFDDGKPQPVHMISRDADPLPVYAVIVLENNEASEPALAKIKKTASLVSSYVTNGMDIERPSLAAVLTVADEVKVVQDFTPDADSLRDTFRRLSATGGAARLIDGVSLACDLLHAQKEPARRIVVLVGETHDLQSKAHFADVVMKAQKDDVIVYTISYSAYTTAFTEKASDRPPPADEPGVYDPHSSQGGMNLLAIPMALAQLAKRNVAEAFAKSTGGAHQKFTTLRGLETQLSAIGTEIHNRYTLTFVPPEAQPAGYHRLSVSIRNASDFRVHARAGYWSVLEKN